MPMIPNLFVARANETLSMMPLHFSVCEQAVAAALLTLALVFLLWLGEAKLVSRAGLPAPAPLLSLAGPGMRLALPAPDERLALPAPQPMLAIAYQPAA